MELSTVNSMYDEFLADPKIPPREKLAIKQKLRNKEIRTKAEFADVLTSTSAKYKGLPSEQRTGASSQSSALAQTSSVPKPTAASAIASGLASEGPSMDQVATRWSGFLLGWRYDKVLSRNEMDLVKSRYESERAKKKSQEKWWFKRAVSDVGESASENFARFAKASESGWAKLYQAVKNINDPTYPSFDKSLEGVRDLTSWMATAVWSPLSVLLSPATKFLWRTEFGRSVWKVVWTGVKAASEGTKSLAKSAGLSDKDIERWSNALSTITNIASLVPAWKVVKWLPAVAKEAKAWRFWVNAIDAGTWLTKKAESAIRLLGWTAAEMRSGMYQKALKWLSEVAPNATKSSNFNELLEKVGDVKSLAVKKRSELLGKYKGRWFNPGSVSIAWKNDLMGSPTSMNGGVVIRRAISDIVEAMPKTKWSMTRSDIANGRILRWVFEKIKSGAPVTYEELRNIKKKHRELTYSTRLDSTKESSIKDAFEEKHNDIVRLADSVMPDDLRVNDRRISNLIETERLVKRRFGEVRNTAKTVSDGWSDFKANVLKASEKIPQNLKTVIRSSIDAGKKPTLANVTKAVATRAFKDLVVPKWAGEILKRARDLSIKKTIWATYDFIKSSPSLAAVVWNAVSGGPSDDAKIRKAANVIKDTLYDLMMKTARKKIEDAKAKRARK